MWSVVKGSEKADNVFRTQMQSTRHIGTETSQIEKILFKSIPYKKVAYKF